MYKTALVVLIASAIFLSSCKTNFQVVHSAMNDIENEKIVYNLPKTKITLSIEVTEIKKQKGEFAEYAHLYFNTKNTIQSNSVEYRISDISLNTVPINDQEQIYAVIPGDNSVISMVNLTPEGFLAGINLSDYQAGKIETEQKVISETIEMDHQPGYGDLSLKSVRETKYDTLYKEVLKDSVIVKVPIISKRDIYKSDKKQANEIANILFLLRDDRNALMIGENDGDNFPDGEGLQIMINEINKLEKQYMSLFIGREIKSKRTFDFEIIPGLDSLEFVIAGFDKYTGLSTDQFNIPIRIQLVLNNYTDIISNLTKGSFQNYELKKKPYEGLIYRIPANVIAEVYMDTQLLYKKNIKISQLGALNILPGDIFNEEITIEFYPQNGSLKRISKFKNE